MIRWFLGFCLVLIATVVQAQERPRAILVLDASGSMWGQIGGVPKIAIAQEVIGDLLQKIPGDQELGLTVYGHRRKGDCSDIETLIAPGVGQRDAIASAVNAIKPKGKTPLSQAVIQAAEQLKYTEEEATVILVSDGRETCDLDPCEVGRKLEETGVNFTAHVIGFDVTKPADRAQLQCLAEETGGTFRTASDAGELAEALLVVAEPPAPQPVDVTFNAKEGPSGPVIGAGLRWVVTDAAGQVILDGGNDMTPTLELLPGDYSARVTRAVDGAEARRDFAVAGPETVVLVLPELPPEPVQVRIHAKDGKHGPRIGDDLVWDVTRDDGESIVSSEIAPNLDLRLVKGTYTVSVLRPADEAHAEQRFGVGTVNKTIELELPEYRPAATIEAPDTAVAGSTIELRWTGPDERNDFIAVARPNDNEGSSINYTMTAEGPLLALRMPPEPGEYEIRYVLNKGRKTLLRKPITITPVSATITPPESLPVGATVPVEWTGPDYRNDAIAVVKPGEDEWIKHSYTREGSPLPLVLPGEPGEYELVYVMGQGRTVLTRVPVTVTDVEYALNAPDAAPAGSTITVDWTGPDNRNDLIAVADTGARDNKWLAHTYTREGSPLELTLPLEPGSYEIRYVLGSDQRVKASRPIEVTPITASISGPETAAAGSRIAVEWEGPDYRNDIIDVARKDDKPGEYLHLTYTREGSPLQLQMPADPGEYELRYVTRGGGTKVLARRPIKVAPVTASLTASDSAPAGSLLSVEWEGPANRNDTIAVARKDDRPDRLQFNTYVREGSPLQVQLPTEPGMYELRYVSQGGGTRILARKDINVEPVSATLTADDSAPAGGRLSVAWDGPGYRHDLIGISRPGDPKGFETVTNVRDGNPLIVKVPDAPGQYELRYFMGQDRRIIARKPLTVK